MFALKSRVRGLVEDVAESLFFSDGNFMDIQKKRTSFQVRDDIEAGVAMEFFELVLASG